MTPDAIDALKAIKRASDKCGNVVAAILDALDIVEFGSVRIQQENPQCTVANIEEVASFILRASNIAETAGILLEIALQKLKEKTGEKAAELYNRTFEQPASKYFNGDPKMKTF